MFYEIGMKVVTKKSWSCEELERGFVRGVKETSRGMWKGEKRLVVISIHEVLF